MLHIRLKIHCRLGVGKPSTAIDRIVNLLMPPPVITHTTAITTPIVLSKLE